MNFLQMLPPKILLMEEHLQITEGNFIHIEIVTAFWEPN